MEMMPVSNGQKIVKLVAVGVLGLGVLLGSSRVTLAFPKTRPGKTYCDCSCKTFSRGTELAWEKVASCNVNGKKCKGTNSAGEVEEGTLEHCQQCKGAPGGGLADCKDAKAAANVGGSKPPAVSGEDAGTSPQPPTSKNPNAGMKHGGVKAQ